MRISGHKFKKIAWSMPNKQTIRSSVRVNVIAVVYSTRRTAIVWWPSIRIDAGPRRPKGNSCDRVCLRFATAYQCDQRRLPFRKLTNDKNRRASKKINMIADIPEQKSTNSFCLRVHVFSRFFSVSMPSSAELSPQLSQIQPRTVLNWSILSGPEIPFNGTHLRMLQMPKTC